MKTNYKLEISKVADMLKNDKATNPKWRNKIVSQLEVAAALCPQLETHEMSQQKLGNLEQYAPRDLSARRCICRSAEPPFDPRCPKHGL